MVAFASDAARDPRSVGESFAQGVRAYLDELARRSGGGGEAERRREAAFIASTLIGALTLARSVREGDPALSDTILAAARETLLARLPDEPKT